MELLALIALGSAVLAAVGAWLGRGSAPATGGTAIALLAGVAAALAVGLPGRPDDVPSGQFGAGVVLAGLLCGFLPAATYLVLGVALARRPGWLAVAWTAMLAPLAGYTFVVFLLVIDRVACAPDAYECPL